MKYTLFDEFITLQALLKELGIIQSGGAIKAFLKEYDVLFNGEKEERRGKKIRLGDIIDIPSKGITITLQKPSEEERKVHLEEVAEKNRVATLVKKLNQSHKKQSSSPTKKTKLSKNKQAVEKRPVRFPGT
ncbi:S4 domain-containing protein YaaA [Streptococcus hillyeri]|uniref:S4 domain-containing protein YaaA n=1 Tax=Streptococcus hillyeri TaxID=2282420 RepID=A0A3L9DTT8_9STRE|nr:S4 domain-containing protein YaaA [Streptococcus hillyeri]RLY03433.1 S4 domain-containing protein YaaA [Streptococcus hillyeri]